MAPRDWPIVLLDGGLGTTLMEPPYDLQFDETTPLWSAHLLLNGTQKLQSAHAEFVTAGAEVILTATYQASFEGFERTVRLQGALDEKSIESQAAGMMLKSLMYAGAALTESDRRPSSRCCDMEFELPCTAISLGPYGATLVPSQEYSGLYPAEMCSQDALRGWHARRLGIFVNIPRSWAEPQFIAFETFKRVDEVHAVRQLMSSGQWINRVEPWDPSETRKTKKKWWISTVWPGEVTNEDVQNMVEAMLENNARGMATTEEAGRTPGYGATPWAIGVNCTGIEKVANIVQKMEDCVTNLAESGRWRSEWASDGLSTGASARAVSSSAARPWLVLYPDGSKGLKYDSRTREWVPDGSIQEDGRAWHEALWEIATAIRARNKWAGLLLGGCCKTKPEHILELRRKLELDWADG